MLIDENSFKVNDISLAPYLTEIEYLYPKLWGEDTGRNLAGTMSGTLVGIFPKFVCHFRRLTKDEIETLAPIFDSQTQTVEYYDPNKKDYTIVETYTNDWQFKQKNLNESPEGIQVSFICVRRR